MFSNSAKYALKAVLFLAVNSSENQKINVKEIAEPINVPQAYIAKLLQELARLNLISSTRGPKGGFFLNEINKNNTPLDIVFAIDGEKQFVNCMLSLDTCNEEKPCPLHKLVSPSRNKIIKHFKNTSIAKLAMEIKAGKSYLPL